MHTLRALLMAGVLGLFFQSCSLSPQAEEVPSFINVNSITFDDTTATFSGIAVPAYPVKYAWAFHNNVFLGVFEIPAKIPVLAEGEGTIKLWGGVQVLAIDGRNHVYGVHPLFRDFVKPVLLERGKEVNIDASIRYNDETPAAFAFSDNFEGDKRKLHLTNGQPMPRVEDQRNQGTGWIGYLVQGSGMQSVVSDTLNLPRGKTILLEFDYKSGGTLALEFRADLHRAGTIYKGLTLQPATEWKKVYVNLTNEVNNAVADSRHLLFFNYTPASSADSLLLDNVRITHRK